MTGNMLSRTAACAVCAFVGVGTVQAKTVALWPLDYDPLNPANAGRCAVNAANDLTCAANNGGGLIDDGYGIGWTLPPNPDATADLLFDPVNRSYVRASSGSYSWSNPQAGLLVSPDRDWTFECFTRLDANPNGMKVFASTFWHVNGNDADRWMLMFKPNAATGGCNVECYCGNPDIRTNNTDYVFAELSAAEQDALRSGYHHLALTHRVDRDAGKTVWKFYYDGVLRDTRTLDALPVTHNRTGLDNAFEIGGRAMSQNAFPGSIDYCRISDEALEPSAFLNAGGAGTVPAKDPTLARWPLGRTAAGTIDGAPSVGTYHLSGGLVKAFESDTIGDKLLVADDDRAFDGQIPNSATSLKASDNVGCLAAFRGESGAALKVPNLGSKLTLTNDFTVEGWYKFENRCQARNFVWLRLCGAFNYNGAGWALQLYYSPQDTVHPCYFALHVQENNTVRLHGSVSPNLGDVALGSEDVWRHLALVYDCDGGEGERGIWRFYVDGVLWGTCTNTQGVTPGLAYPADFYLNDASAGTPQAAAGKYDHWRVCRAALAPEQFLCATDGARDATDVLAYWPMDAKRGVYLDGRDLTGSYTFTKEPLDSRMAAVVDDTPPQAGRAADAGSVGFANHGGNNAYLVTTEADVRELFRSPNWTFESWLKRTDGNTIWQVLFGASSGNVAPTLTGWPGSAFFFTYRPENNKGFVMWSDNTVSDTQDKAFTDGNGGPVLLPLNEWVHVALSFENDGTTARYRLYTNGTEAATMSGSFKGYSTVGGFLVGGRPLSANSFRGYMADMRLSSKTLVPGEFLCDETSPVRSTIGFWPLDYANGQFDLGNRLGLLADFGSHAVTGLVAGARHSVPNPDASAGFKGDPTHNTGAVALTSGGWAGTSLASYLGGAFTAEGWIKWSNTAGAVCETVVGSWNIVTNGGWRLMLDSTVSPAKFHLHARYGKGFTRIVDGLFPYDASTLKDDWHHLALAYDPLRATGVWTLSVDGMMAGSVTNFFRPTLGIPGDGLFRLGADPHEPDAVSFIGGVDMWRLSAGALTKEDFLYRRPSGTVVYLR